MLRNVPRLVKRNLLFTRQLLRDLEIHLHTHVEARSLLARIIEQHRLLRTSAIDAEDYYHHALYRPTLPFRPKTHFLGKFQYMRYFQYLNPAVFDILARDKELFEVLAHALDIPTPKVIATTGDARTPSLALHLPDAAALRAWLAAPHIENLFLKPADGHFGEGALSLGRRLQADPPVWERMPTRQPIGLDEVVEHLSSEGKIRRFLIQERLVPHPVLAAIVPDVCSTIRAVTLSAPHPVLIGAALRLGNGIAPTDNLAGGGMAVAIDRADGLLGRAVVMTNGLPTVTDMHPVTGQRISGVFLPHWKEIEALIVDSASKIPFLHLIGWDVAITRHGPVIVEINTCPGVSSIQMTQDQGLLAGPLGMELAKHRGIAQSGLTFRL